MMSMSTHAHTPNRTHTCTTYHIPRTHVPRTTYHVPRTTYHLPSPPLIRSRRPSQPSSAAVPSAPGQRTRPTCEALPGPETTERVGSRAVGLKCLVVPHCHVAPHNALSKRAAAVSSHRSHPFHHHHHHHHHHRAKHLSTHAGSTLFVPVSVPGRQHRRCQPTRRGVAQGCAARREPRHQCGGGV